MTTLQPFKAYLSAFRSCSPTTTAATAEALLHVADGVDSVAELQQVMDLSGRTAHRIVSTLLGRGLRLRQLETKPFQPSGSKTTSA